MQRSIALTSAFVFVPLVPLAWLFGGCGDGVVIGEFEQPGVSPFTTLDGGDASDATEEGLVTYCPSNTCPHGFTTCAESRFPCDVNLLSDRNNCGACGVACPAPTFRETYECIEGRCVAQCDARPRTLDCDGLVDNGCEVDPTTNDDCGACGNKCLDPAKPCVDLSLVGDAQCGCNGDDLYCPHAFPACVDAKTNDSNCGGCDVVCDPAGDSNELPDFTYAGCVDGHCGMPKCLEQHGDCDHDLSNGCETSFFSDDSCGGCNNACPAGQHCLADEQGLPVCGCPSGQTYCSFGCFGDFCSGTCVDLTSDKKNCGGCGVSCVDVFETNSFSVCTYGTCTRHCVKGHADCNGNPSDDCEVDTDSDPRNCGGCGKACDLMAGQACVGGQCVVEPCAPDAGPVGGAR